MTVHEDAAERVLEDFLGYPATAELLASTHLRLTSGELTDDDVAHIGQTHRGARSWSSAQVAAYLQVHMWLMDGTVAHVPIGVGRGSKETPGPDADREGNAAKLVQVNGPFTAGLDIWQNGADQDGTLSWDVPIHMNRSSGLGLLDSCGGRTTPIEMTHWAEPFSAPLEVGFTLPSRTLFHLMVERCVARWPYGQPYITLITFTDMWAPRS